MRSFLLRRLAQGLLAIVGVSLIAFIAVRMTGDLERFLLPPDAGEQDFARVRAEYGLAASERALGRPLQAAAAQAALGKAWMGNRAMLRMERL
jgi:ABC-type dipeptide/oligopeptide/nickel transport system permease component